jgi:hypothetical protein
MDRRTSKLPSKLPGGVARLHRGAGDHDRGARVRSSQRWIDSGGALERELRDVDAGDSHT